MGLEPLVSVIVPVRDEARFINRCLQTIFGAERVAGGMEVIVVDGMSEDGTRQILAEWCARHSNLRFLDNPRHIVPTAMNIGIRAAKGRWIIRVDAHSEYPPDYFKRCLETSRRTGGDNVGGSIDIAPGDRNWKARLVHAVTTHPFGVGNSRFRIGSSEGKVDTVPYGCFRSEVFEQIGLYDERLSRNEDYELNCRLRKTGGSIWHDPAIRIFYHHDRPLVTMLKKAFLNGQWNPWTWHVAPYSFTWRHAAPAAFVGTILATLLLSLIEPFFGGLAFWGLLAPYCLSAGVASLQQSKRNGLWMLPYLPFLFCGYHLIYGLGGLWGICVLALGRAPTQTAHDRGRVQARTVGSR